MTTRPTRAPAVPPPPEAMAARGRPGPGLDANALELFARIVAAGSFAAAARQMGQTRAAVSRRLAAIESVAGASLLVRTTRTLGLTEAGRRLHPQARAVLDAADAARRGLRAGRGELTGTLRVTTTTSFGRVVLAPLLVRFRAQHPAVRLDVLATDRPMELLRDGIDVAFRITRRPPPDWVAREVLPFRVRAFAAPGMSGPLDHPSALAALPCLLFGAQGDAQRTPWLRDAAAPTQPGAVPAATGEAAAVAVTLAPAVSSSDMDALLAMARAGGGVVLAPDYCVGPDLAAGTLHDVLPGWHLPVAEGDAVLALQLPLPSGSEAARQLVRFVADALAVGGAGAAMPAPGR